ncbi:putative pentatricopeptide repeat-containing protein At1g69350, mitochondrial [Hibiscus syriacus]|uniref:putative pentatricopeptide repeat-containing protein At1g69350, mitochondrial n=1 Tax=Hibiscus syriacus TaxID=106335 RepID=UPI001922749A|nr:putative pentatricopeptide repeat-containing protein At1g69350, mitochondrial [Hibiscus syriacus]
MVLEGIRPDSVTMLSVAEACGDLGFLKLARSIHCYIVRRKIESDGSLASSLVPMYSKCGDLGSAERIFVNVTKRSTSLWTAIICSYHRNDRFVEALQSFVSMLDSRVEPNSVTMMSVLGSFAGLGWLREGKLVHCYIIRREMDLDYDVLGSVFIELYMKCGELNYCENVLCIVGGGSSVAWKSSRFTRGLMPDSFSLASSLSACADGELAYMIFDEIKEKSAVMWNPMICGFHQNGNSVEAISLFDQMYLNGLEMNDETFLSVLQACSNLGYLEEGKWLHHKLLTYGERTDLYIGTALTDMYAKCGDLLTAQRVFNSLQNHQIDAIETNNFRSYTDHICKRSYRNGRRGKIQDSS